MDIDRLAQSAVDVVAQHLSGRAVDAAGRLTDAAVDQVYQLIVNRLGESSTGRRIVSFLQHNPADNEGRARVAEMVTDELRSDPEFADSLGRAAQRAGLFVQGPAASYQVVDNRGDFRGNVAGRDIRVKYRRFHIGQFQFGTGGLAVGIVALLVLGGGTAAVVAGSSGSTRLDQVVGKWERPGDTVMPGFEQSPTVLTVSANGEFTFSLGLKMGMPGGNRPPSGIPDFSSIQLRCNGSVEPAGDHFTFRSTTGQCGTFEGKVSADGKAIDVFLTDGSTDGATALTKVG